MRVVLKVYRKGIVVLPKRVREALGIREGDEVVVEVVEGKLVMRPLRPRVVDVDPGLVEEEIRGERGLWERRLEGMMRGEEAGPRR